MVTLLNSRLSLRTRRAPCFAHSILLENHRCFLILHSLLALLVEANRNEYYIKLHKKYLCPKCLLIVYWKGDIVKDPMKSVSFVYKTIPAGGASQSTLDCLWVDWHRSKRWIFIFYHCTNYTFWSVSVVNSSKRKWPIWLITSLLKNWRNWLLLTYDICGNKQQLLQSCVIIFCMGRL